MLVFDTSNAQQQFHLLSMSVISHHLQEIYEDMLSNFKQLITHIIPAIIFTPKYRMMVCEVTERCFTL